MKNEIQALMMMTAVLVVSSSSFGQSCRNTDKVQKDMQDFGDLLAQSFDSNPMKKINFVVNENERVFSFDRSKIPSDHPLRLSERNGILTKEADVNIGAIESQQQIYGNALPLTCRDVVVAFHTPDSASGGTNDKPALKIGQPFHVHLGQGESCDGNGAFKVNQSGTVIDMGTRADGRDWAIIRLDKPQKKVSPMPFTLAPPAADETVLRLGHPVKETLDDGGFKNIYVQKTKVLRSGKAAGLFQLSDRGQRHGMSGGPVLKFTPKGLKAFAITIGADDKTGANTVLTFHEIFSQMEENGRNVLPTIREALVNKSICD